MTAWIVQALGLAIKSASASDLRATLRRIRVALGSDNQDFKRPLPYDVISGVTHLAVLVLRRAC